MSQPGVTVVVPVYNGEGTIGSCIESLLAIEGAGADPEILVVDNGSSDGTRDILDGYRDHIRIIQEPRRGASAARNRGILSARGDIIAFTDADCTVAADWLTHIVQPLRDPDVGVVGGKILVTPGSNEVQMFGERIYDHRQAIEEFSPPYAITANWAMSRRVLGHVGHFDVNLLAGHDVDLAWRVVQWGYRLRYAEDAIVHHRNRSTRWGLFRQGCQHGYWGLAVTRKHRAFVERHGSPRFQWYRYREVLMDALRPAEPALPGCRRCGAIFNSGRILGRLSGAVRFGYFAA